MEIHLIHKDDEVVITRQKKPTKLELLVGKENKTGACVADTQKEIDALLNINHKVLLASMFFGQSNDVNFLDCTAEDKRTIIRNFLNLDDIFQMRDKIKSHKSTFYQGMKEKDAVISDNNKNIKKLDVKVREIEEAKKEYSSYEDYDMSLTLEDILEGEAKERDITQTILAHDQEIFSLTAQINECREQVKNPSSLEVCNKCGSEQKITVDPTLIKNRMDRLEISLSNQERMSKKLKLSRCPPTISSKEFSKLQDYRDLCRDETNYTDMKDDLSVSITEAQTIKDTHKTWYEVMRFWEKAFSEQGVIKYIINNVLEYFNERCNYYLSYLTNSKYSVQFDEELTEKIETNGRLLSYISLSGGEKRKLNLAVLLGLKDLLLLTDKSHVDLLFFDEVAENIDEEGIDGLHQLLLELKKSKTIFIITHNKYLKTLLDSSPRLSIIKHKGISQIKE